MEIFFPGAKVLWYIVNKNSFRPNSFISIKYIFNDKELSRKCKYQNLWFKAQTSTINEMINYRDFSNNLFKAVITILLKEAQKI